MEFLAWLYNESSVRDHVVVNDRWGKGCRGRHGGHYTTEYGSVDGNGDAGEIYHPWEECRGIGRSFGYNRFETAADYMSTEDILELLSKTVSGGGNLLLDIGPTADGRIPPVMECRLLEVGKWLDSHGEAIYGTSRAQGISTRSSRVYLTAKKDYVYAIVFGDGSVPVRLKTSRPVALVEQIGDAPLRQVMWSQEDSTVVFEAAPRTGVAVAFKITLKKMQNDERL